MRWTLTRMLFLGLLATGGAAGAAYYGGVIDKPTFGITDRGDWGAVTDDRVDIHTTLWVHNPNPLGINVSDVRATYRIHMNGVALADGEKKEIAVQQGNNTVELTTALIHKNVPRWWARHLQQDESSLLKASAQVYLGFLPTAPTLNGLTYTDTVDTNLIGMLNDSMKQVKGTYTGPGTTIAGVDTRPKVEIRGGSAEWGRITQETTRLRVTVDIHNPNSYPIPVPGLDGDLTMNDQQIGTWSSENVQVVDAPADRIIPAGGTRSVTFNIDIANDRIDDWFVSHVEQGEHTDASTTIRLRFDIGSIRLYVPQDSGLTCTFSITTAILADENTETSEFNGCDTGDLTPSAPDTDQQQDGDSSGDDGTQDPSLDDGDGSNGDGDSDSGDGVLDGVTGNLAG